MKVKHIEWLVTGICTAILAIVPRVFWPTDPPTILQVELGLGLIALMMLARAFDARDTWRPESTLPRLLWRLFQVTCLLFLFPTFLWMHGSGFMVATMVSANLGLGIALVELLVLVWCLAQWVRRPDKRARAQIVGAIALFLGSFQFVGWALWMWSPPSAETCAAVDQPAYITHLSPPAWARDASQPYDLLYLPEEGYILASFKMAGNGGVPFLDDEVANRVLGVDARDPQRRFVIPLPGRELPQYMTYDARAREVLVSRLGGSQSWLDVIDVSTLPEAQLARQHALPYSTHEVVTHPSEAAFGVFSDIGEFALLDQERFTLRYDLEMRQPGDHSLVTMNAWHHPGTSKVYISSLFYPLAELNMDTREVRWTGPLFGGGQLTGDPASARVFVTDILLHRVDIIAMDSLELESRLELDYAPRPVVVDSARDLLIVGGWLDGVLRIYRLSDLSLLSEEVSVGPYIRDLAYDTESGALFAGSQCGLYQVNLGAITEGLL